MRTPTNKMAPNCLLHDVICKRRIGCALSWYELIPSFCLQNIATLKQNLLSATTEDFKRLKECLEELESVRKLLPTLIVNSFGYLCNPCSRQALFHYSRAGANDFNLVKNRSRGHAKNVEWGSTS